MPTATHVWIYLFHVLFFAAFIPRGLLRLRRSAKPGPVAPAEPATPTAQVEARAPHAIALLVVHGIGFFLLYVGIGAGFGPETRVFFPPRRVLGGVVTLAATAVAGWAIASFRSWRLRAAVTPGHELATGGAFQ
ncbi:MAG: hypothetical protein M3O15_06385, partial [Acidobacteriota bacterium]|nr:hypothetical protein [Acidobacteriota bacterium]